jgi:hypothetical protein
MSHPQACRDGAEGEGQMIRLGPRPAGRSWTRAEDEHLLALLDSDMDKVDKALIARKMKRTVQAIGARKRILNKRLAELRLKK